MANQVLTILIRNFQTIRHQKFNMFCNVITPVSCLFFIWVVKAIVQEEIAKTPFSLKLNIPIIYNMPFYGKLKYSNLTAKTTTCEEWYLYDFENRTDNITRNEFENMLNSGYTLKSFCDDNPSLFNMSPYFKSLEEAQMLDNETNVNAYLYDRSFDLNYIDYEDLLNQTSMTKVPDGAITVKKFDNKNFIYQMQITDLRIPFYHRGNGVSLFYVYNSQKGAEKYERYPSSLLGMMWGMGLFHNAYLKKLYNVTVMSGLLLMPIRLEDNEENIQRVINVVGATFYPISISLLMPLFMYNIVIEKERQLIEIMRINGLKIRNYWISYFIFFYAVYIVTIVFFILAGTFLFGLNLFVETSFLLIFLTIFIWGFAQIALAFFFQAFLNNGRTTSIIGYIIAAWLTLTSVSVNLSCFVIPVEAPYFLNLFPTFALCRIFFYMTTYCGYESCISDFSNVNNEVRYALLYMFIGSIIFGFLGVYLYEVLPKKYGIRKNPLYCVECEKDSKVNYLEIDKEKNEEDNKIKIIDNENLDNIDNKDNEIKEISTDDNKDKKEKEANENNNILKDKEIENEFIIVQDLIDKGEKELIKYPLVCNGLTKIYSSNLKSKDPKKKNKKSLDNFTVCLKDNEIFGLLGPNGAGKTTFFSILTGIYEPTSGNAFIRGHSIRSELERSHEFIGYCPQFDLLWEDLSVENTLLFYSRIKNKETSKIYRMVDKVLKDVKLTKFKNYLVRELSGGMKRRLSLGIALIGEPPIVFLDEPTTGLDPKNKREIWDILFHCKQDRCMILTTHLMDEAETLCDRIGIILKGKIRCLGTQYKLKSEYGKGFKLCINLKPYLIEDNLDDKMKEDDDESQKEDNIMKESSDRKIGFVFDKNKIKEINRKNELRIEKVEHFVKNIYTKDCVLIEKHRSAVIFEIGNDVFNPEILFKELEKSKEELEITNWAISQVDLEDIFIKLTEKDL